MKSLKERIAEREARKEKAQKEAEQNGTAQPVADDGAEVAEYGEWTVAELKAELDERGVSYASNSVKADLVKALEDNDAEG